MGGMPGLPGPVVVETRFHDDDRGRFFETWSRDRYAALGLPTTFVQDNVSISKHGVLRGLHYQWPDPQGKLVTVLKGAVYDVAVDVRLGSPTFGRWLGVELSSANGRQFWLPEGFAHGFAVLGESAVVLYKCTGFYNPRTERTIRWDDPVLAIDWPVEAPVLSPKDASAPLLDEMPADALPTLSLAVADG